MLKKCVEMFLMEWVISFAFDLMEIGLEVANFGFGRCKRAQNLSFLHNFLNLEGFSCLSARKYCQESLRTPFSNPQVYDFPWISTISLKNPRNFWFFSQNFFSLLILSPLFLIKNRFAIKKSPKMLAILRQISLIPERNLQIFSIEEKSRGILTMKENFFIVK